MQLHSDWSYDDDGVFSILIDGDEYIVTCGEECSLEFSYYKFDLRRPATELLLQSGRDTVKRLVEEYVKEVRA